MSKLINAAASAAVGIALLAGCTSGQLGVEPTTQVADVQNGTVLQFAVGTANFAGTVYLNTLETYRQANGLSATLYNTPSITGPAGFVVASPAPTTNTDFGTNHISGTAPTQPGTTAVVTTFGQTGGAFGYGFAPDNSNTAGSAVFTQYNSPQYVASARPFLLGPPVTPDTHSGTYPTGFLGFSSGFVAFGVTPVAGQYTLTVTVPGNSPGSAPLAVKTATGTLTNTAGLPTIPPPTVTPTTGGGGASFTVLPQPVGTTNQVLYVRNVTQGTYYSFDATGGGTFVLSATAGGTDPAGVPKKPFLTGDTIRAYVVAANYNIIALSSVVNSQQSPALPAEADITVSANTDKPEG
ncbi:MAG: Amylase [Candidatus Eremiobacteraeota bacterium]|nr:Amylase [Candidatus Eremiobacteraeota bacterium]